MSGQVKKIMLMILRGVSFALVLPLRTVAWICFGVARIFVWPLRGKRNFLTFLLLVLVGMYVWFVEERFKVLSDKFGGYSQLFCDEIGARQRLKESVVRVVGSASEGSGFFIIKNEVLTNYHVIDGEPYPKVIADDGEVLIPKRITAYKDADLAILYMDEKVNRQVLESGNDEVAPGTRVLSAGYPMGTDIVGDATIMAGTVNGIRKSSKYVVGYVQTDISLVKGMSGGPLVDTCGNLVGVNTLGVAGLSFFISADSLDTHTWDKFSDTDITRVEIDPTISPSEAVRAFYVYLKARNMKEGFDLLSRKYLEKTNFEEWTRRFNDVIDVEVISSTLVEGTDDEVFVKFTTNNWNGDEATRHYYEGIWETVWEDGKYKMLKSMIKEVEEPDWSWFYE